ncbi:MAG: 16S rRNA (cytosine(1402)-N(4))-methyltransferase RsmH [Clostridiales bacterium]|nr:16S rRNA (cytosine(1402)-N(4))-methyltransferase RsmH [Clostridiales bacterium]
MEFKHISVLKEESIVGLNIKPDGIYVDCTTGGGGHSLEIAKRLTTGRLICFDKDTDALSFAQDRLKDHADKITFVNRNFADIDDVLKELDIDAVDGILADLGVSSYQIDTAERGFSFMRDARLDMRMDKSQSLDAYQVVNTYSEENLAHIMFMYGEEKNSKQIARKIVKFRENKPLETTFELKDIVVSSYPPKFQNKPSLCNKVFQAIRIEVNNELNDLPIAVEKMLSKLKKDGRLCIITFHPLEDRIVKTTFKTHATDCLCPPRIPKCVCGHKADIRLITKHPIVPEDNELLANSRSGSAKLRIAEKL